jgi:hypothetical protein
MSFLAIMQGLMDLLACRDIAVRKAAEAGSGTRVPAPELTLSDCGAWGGWIQEGQRKVGSVQGER